MAIWFLLPSILYVVVLVAVPFFLAIGFAFSDVTAGDPSFQWAGLRTFERALDDPVFWRSLRNTFVFTVVSMALIVVLGKVLANILVADFRGKWLVRFLVLLPWTTPVALSAVAWLWMLDSVFSPIDWALRNLGLIDGNIYWLGRPHLAMASVIAVHVWRLVPLSAVIILAGLVAIPKDIEEAARVDEAGFWRRMLEVTIPLTLPVVAVAALFGAILTFTDMTVVYVLTRGGPTTPPRCWPAGRSSAASRAATSPRGRWRCSCSRCCWPRPSPSCGRSGAWRCCRWPPRVPKGVAAERLRRHYRRRHVMARVGLYVAAVLAAFICAARSCGAWSPRSSRTATSTTREQPVLLQPGRHPRPPPVPAARHRLPDLRLEHPVGGAAGGGHHPGAGAARRLLPGPAGPALVGPDGHRHLLRLPGAAEPALPVPVAAGRGRPAGLDLVAGAGLPDHHHPGVGLAADRVPQGHPQGRRGAGHGRRLQPPAFVRVVLPLAFPGIVAVVVFAFTLTASEFIYALAFVSPTTEKVVSTGVPTELIRGDVFFWQSLQAAAILVAVPIAFVFNLSWTASSAASPWGRSRADRSAMDAGKPTGSPLVERIRTRSSATVR